jgi:hypothetical protein
VSQISPPIRIVILAAVAFLAAYMLVLRPKDEPVPAAPETAPNVQTGEPAVSEPGKVAEAAQQAADAANAQLQAQESIDGVEAGESAAATGATTKDGKAGASGKGGAAAIPADLKGVPAPVAKAIGKEKTLVLLFWNDRAADDRAVRSQLREVDRWDGRVLVHAAPIKSISRYGRITRGADVEQSPTVVVVDTELRAERVVGYVDTTTIDQMVVDALRNSDGLFKVAYLREVNQVCAKYSSALWALPDAESRRDVSELVTTWRTKFGRFAGDFNAVKAPKKWRGFERASVRDLRAAQGIYGEASAYLGANPSIARIIGASDRFDSRLNAIERRFNRRMDDEHVLSCGSSA